MANGVYAPDGSWRGTSAAVATAQSRMAPDGSLRMTTATIQTGYTAPDGSIYIDIIADGVTGNGLYNNRGNLRVVKAETVTGNGLYAKNGAIRVTGLP